jgi:hypothetical protein
LESFLEIGAGSNNGPNHLDTVEYGLKNGQLHVVIRWQRHKDKAAAAAQGMVSLLKGLRRDSDAYGRIGAARIMGGPGG